MDREVVGLVLAALAGATLPLGAALAGLLPPARLQGRTGEAIECAAALRLLLPVLPFLMALAALVGWAAREPDASERVPPHAWIVAAILLIVGSRAAARAVVALRRFDVSTAATLGILRPHVVVAPGLARRLDEASLRAVVAHEEAHRRHRDPLRIWLAQVVTDLQWPMPGASARFDAWLLALEMARDEDARITVDGADLAAALLEAAQIERGSARAIAGIGGDPRRLAMRIDRLLAPLPGIRPGRAGSAFTIVVAAILLISLLAGANFGEAIVREGLGWAR